jgi:signal peptidase I
LTVNRLRRTFQFVVVNGESMRPTFRDGDLVVGRRHVPSVSPGDVIVFTVDSDDFDQETFPAHRRRVKRIVAAAGDLAPEALPERLTSRHNGFVPVGHVAVAGDAPASQGSAEFGYIQLERVESVIIKRLRGGRHRALGDKEESHDLARRVRALSEPGRLYPTSLGPRR